MHLIIPTPLHPTKKLLRHTLALLCTVGLSASAFAGAIDFTDPTRPMFAGGGSLWSALLSVLGLG